MNFAVVALLLLILTGCAAGPKYQRSNVTTPPVWSSEEPWRAAEPRDGIPKGTWWKLYQDPALDVLEEQSLSANQSIQVAASRVEQARDLARVQVAGYFPTLSGQHVERPSRRALRHGIESFSLLEAAGDLVVIASDDRDRLQRDHAIDDGVRIRAVADQVAEHQRVIVFSVACVGMSKLLTQPIRLRQPISRTPGC